MIVILKGVKLYLALVLTCIFLIISDVEDLSKCLLAVCLEKSLFSSPVHFLIAFFFLFMSSLNSFYILYFNSFPDRYLASILSCSVGCLFILLSFLWYAKSFYLMRPHLFIFVLFYFAFAYFVCTWGDRSRKILLKPMSKGIMPIFSSRRLVVLHFTCKPVIHFELFFGGQV